MFCREQRLGADRRSASRTAVEALQLDRPLRSTLRWILEPFSPHWQIRRVFMRLGRVGRFGITGALVAASLGASIVFTPASASAASDWW